MIAKITDESLPAYIKQLASIGYTQMEICRKIHITPFKLNAFYINDFKRGQKLYIDKQLALFKQQQNKQ